MAYMSKAHKAEIAKLLKKEFGTDAKKRGFKYTLSVRNLSTIVMTISAGSIDFIGNANAVREKEATRRNEEHHPREGHYQVNVYSYDRHFTGKAGEIIKKAIKCLNLDNYDNSDVMTDYFDIGHYVELNIGSWDKAYKLEA